MGYDIQTESPQEGQPNDQIFVRVRTRLLKIALSRRCTYDDAEDAVQDAMLACLRRWGHLRSHADGVIEDYLVITVIRIADRLARRSMDLELDEIADQADPTSDPCGLTLRRELQIACLERLQVLPTRSRRIVLDRQLGLSWEAVGERSGVAPANARLIYHRALKLLRERMDSVIVDDRNVA